MDYHAPIHAYLYVVYQKLHNEYLQRLGGLQEFIFPGKGNICE